MALVWAARTHQETVQSLPDVLARDFRPLLEGDDIADIRLEDIEQRAEEVKSEYPYISEVIVRKITANGDSRIVYPFFYYVDQIDTPPEDDPTFQFKVLESEDGTVLGTLYVKISAQRSLLFLTAIVGSIVALMLVVGLGLYTIQSKDQEVRKTTSLLEEKQRELIHLERLALVGQVTANLMHDLKKPVLNIRAEAAAISNEEVRNTILEETDLFSNMIRGLQIEGFLRRDKEKAEFVDIGDMIDRSLKLVKYAQQQVRVDVEIPDNLPFVLAQKHQLIQVFSNILLNAFQALEGEGSVKLSAYTVEEDSEHWLEIAISDDGPGMAYEVVTRIFEPFYTSGKDDEATGLGLYISKSIVESMGGTITAESIPKHGTTFTIRFPLSEEEAPQL